MAGPLPLHNFRTAHGHLASPRSLSIRVARLLGGSECFEVQKWKLLGFPQVTLRADTAASLPRALGTSHINARRLGGGVPGGPHLKTCYLVQTFIFVCYRSTVSYSKLLESNIFHNSDFFQILKC